MKKMLAMALALAMVFSLAACGGGNDDPKPSGSEGNTPPSSSQQTEQPGNTPDPGTDESSDAPDDGVEWPKNQFTDLLPKPESGTIFYEKAVDNAYFEGHTITMADWTVEDCKAYADALIAAGFTIPGDGYDSVVVRDDDEMYSFGAKNADGVYVTCGTSAVEKAGNISIQVAKEG